MKIIDVPQTGKCRLTVTYPARNGLIRRSWVVPSNPNSSAQALIRSNLRTQAQAYDALTEAQQNAWIAAAAQYRTKPTLGQSGPMSGLQLFVKVNCANLTIGNATVNTPPASFAQPILPITGLVITNTSNVVAMKLSVTDSPPDGTMLWGCSWQRSGTRRAVSPRFLGTLDSPGNNAITITALYTTRFGVPPVGARVFVQVNSNINGWEGQRVTFSAIVPTST